MDNSREHGNVCFIRDPVDEKTIDQGAEILLCCSSGILSRIIGWLIVRIVLKNPCNVSNRWDR